MGKLCQSHAPGGASSAITFVAPANSSGTEFIDIWVSYGAIKSLTKASGLVTGSIPVGTSVEVVAVAQDQDGNFVMHNSNETVMSGHSVTLDLKVTTSAAITAVMDGL